MANLDYLLSEPQGKLYVDVTYQDARRASQVFNDEPQFDLYIDKVLPNRYESNDIDMMITFLKRLGDMHIEITDTNVEENMDARDADFELEGKKGTDGDGDGDIDSKDYLAARSAAIQKSMKGKKIKKSQLGELVKQAIQNKPARINEAGKEYKWKEAPRNKYSDPNVVNKKEMLTQVAAAVDDLVKLTNEKGKYITPTLGGMSQTHTPETIVGQFLSKQVRGFVDKYDNDLEGIKILDKNGYATYEPIWKEKEPKSVSGPDPRGASLDENPMGAMGSQAKGAVQLPKATPVNQITQLTDKGVDVKLFELEKQYFDYVDDEGRMAKRDLLKIVKYAIELYRMMEDDTQLEGWVQAKLVKASDYMSAVKHYLEGEERVDAVDNAVVGENLKGTYYIQVDPAHFQDAVKIAETEFSVVPFEFSAPDTIGFTDISIADDLMMSLRKARIGIIEHNIEYDSIEIYDLNPGMYEDSLKEITAYDYQQQQEPETLQGDQDIDIRGKLQKILPHLNDEPVDQVRNFVRMVHRDIHDYEQMSSNDILAKYRVMFPSPDPLQETKKNRRVKK